MKFELEIDRIHLRKGGASLCMGTEDNESEDVPSKPACFVTVEIPATEVGMHFFEIGQKYRVTLEAI